ncbi:palmitoyltransferase pfa5 [Orbilia brochopaga]|uniref:Palmitoyltransferase n=1 Tax=Orbilia brochopaga TaxID=3140254 RepID=A0AAV9U8W3_9PEZI
MCDRRQANIWTARFMPVVLTGMAGYATYVFLVRLCINFLLHPPATESRPRQHASSKIPTIVTNSSPAPRTATAIGLMVGYLIFLLLMAAAYYRVVFTIMFNPGYTPLGPSAYGTSGEGKEAWVPPATGSTARDEKASSQPQDSSAHGITQPTSPQAASPQAGPQGATNSPLSPRGGFQALSARPDDQPNRPLRQPLTQVFLRDIFLCDANGEVRWCARCGNYKPDRTHHCSEVGRCVENFDHFCPWVGGVVGLTSYKFFVQFVGYGSLYCVYTVICMAVFFKEKVSHYGFTQEDGHWVAVIAMGGFFGLFIIGMFITSLQMLYWGSSTLENFDRKTKRYFVARLDPNQDLEPTRRRRASTSGNQSRQPQSKPFWLKNDGTRDDDSGFQRRLLLPLPSPRRVVSPARSPIVSPMLSPTSPTASKEGQEEPIAAPRRYYRIYLTPAGLHPWRVGFKRNFKQIMGPRLWDWLLPVYRPYRRPTSHDSDEETADGMWSAKELWKQMKADGWAAGEHGAAMAREGGVARWYDFGDDFIDFLNHCDEQMEQ